MKEISIDKYARIYFALVVIFLLKQYADGLLLFQFDHVVFKYPSIDNTYWLFYLLQIPQLLASSKSSLLIFDLALLFSCISNVIFIQRVWLARIFAVLFFIYFICVNSFSGHHSHMLVGILLSNVVFCFRSLHTQLKLKEILRYYLLFLMTSAAFWKIGRGNLSDVQHFSNILFNQHIYELIASKKNLHTHIISYLIEHTPLSYSLYIIATICEIIFIVGFFTKKYDRYLILVFILFFSMDYLLMDLNFVELSVLLLTFIPLKKINS
ncbi:MAG: hypothetical protein WCP57_05925 [Bacteroidota bacterium]